MKKFLMLFFVLGFIGILGACGEDDRKDPVDTDGMTSISISFDTPVEDVVFTSDSGNSITVRIGADTNVTLEGFAIGDTITLSHDGVVFTPDTLTVTETNQAFNVSVDVQADDTEDTDDTENTDDTEDTDDDNVDDGDQDDEDAADTMVSAEVDSVEAINAALLDDTVESIVFTSDIVGSFTVSKLVQVDLNMFTLDGNLLIETSDEGTLVIAEGTITGNLDIDGPALTVENHATVEGYVNVEQVASATYVEYGLNNDIRIYADNSHVIIMNDTLQVGVLANQVNVTLEANVEIFSAESSFVGITVINADRIYEAIIYSSDVLLDNTPVVLSGNKPVQFTLPVIEALNVETDFNFDHGVVIDTILNGLPETVEITVDGDTLTVDIIEYIIDSLSYDLTTLDSQTLEIKGVFAIPDNVLNGNYLEPVFTVTVLSYRDSNDGITGYTPLDTVEIEYGAVQSLSTIEEDYLPAQVEVLVESGTPVLVDVEWTLDQGSFDDSLDTAQNIVFTGELINLPEGIHNLDEVLITINVVVMSNPDVLEDPYGQVHVQATIPDAVEITIHTESASATLDSVTIVVTVNPGYNYYGMRLFTMDSIFETELTYETYVSKTGSLHIVIEVEAIDRIELSDAFDSGDGTDESPFVITTTEQLSNMRYFLDEGYHFILGNDITFLENEYFEPMSSPNNLVPFNGVFDGGLFTIYNYKVTTSDDTEHSAFIDVNAGVIKNVNFVNAEVVSLYDLLDDGNLVGTNHGLIMDVSMSGSRVGKGGGLVGINYGLIKDVSVDFDLENTQGGVVNINRGIIDGVEAIIDLLVNQNILGNVAGIVRYNGATANGVAVVNDVTGTITILYDNTVNSLNGTYIAGFAGLNVGHQETMHQAMIMSSNVTVHISAVNNTMNEIYAFIETNGNLGVINHIVVDGEVYGHSIVTGFAKYNNSGINPGVISNVTTYVDVYGTGVRVSGFIHTNSGYNVETQYKAQIIDSNAYGNVTGTNFLSKYASYQDGIVTNSQGYGTLIVIED